MKRKKRNREEKIMPGLLSLSERKGEERGRMGK
jgi:hypothetical protein